MGTVARHTAVIAGGALLVALITGGCTLTGATAAPLTPVIPTPSGEVETPVIPTPTELAPIDVFGTQTALAPTATPTETLTPTPETPTATPTPVCPSTHTVQAGENLYRIALRYGLTYQELAAANGIANPNAIQAGMVLTIPGCGGEEAPTEEGGEILYTVKAGDTLFRIALRYGLTVEELAAYNGITNPDAIAVGQVIRIPPRD